MTTTVAAVLGQLLPLAVGVAVSPLPIIAVILLLLGPRARGPSLGFLAGWLAGIATVVLVVVALSSVADLNRTGGPSTAVAWIKILLGALLVVLGVRQWRHRPAGDGQPEQPGWLTAIDGVGTGKAGGLAFLLAAVNPKNLTLCAGAGLAIGAADLDGLQTTFVVVVFALLAGSTVLVPVVASAVAAERLAAPLAELRDWLAANNAVVMSVLFTVMGAVLAGQGLQAL